MLEISTRTGQIRRVVYDGVNVVITAFAIARDIHDSDNEWRDIRYVQGTPYRMSAKQWKVTSTQFVECVEVRHGLFVYLNALIQQEESRKDA